MRHKKRLRFSQLPCVIDVKNEKHKDFIPMELIDIVSIGHQRTALEYLCDHLRLEPEELSKYIAENKLTENTNPLKYAYCIYYKDDNNNFIRVKYDRLLDSQEEGPVAICFPFDETENILWSDPLYIIVFKNLFICEHSCFENHV